jgi:hypothetical protein
MPVEKKRELSHLAEEDICANAAQGKSSRKYQHDQIVSHAV